VIGLTIEGIATAVAERMPPECQPGVMQATVSLLLDRFAA
jgi:hypothetical protein